MGQTCTESANVSGMARMGESDWHGGSVDDITYWIRTGA
jgi:hypothetical protein